MWLESDNTLVLMRLSPQLSVYRHKSENRLAVERLFDFATCTICERNLSDKLKISKNSNVGGH